MGLATFALGRVYKGPNPGVCGFRRGMWTPDHAVCGPGGRSLGTAPTSASGPGRAADTRGGPAWRLTHGAGLVLVGQLLGLPRSVDVVLHLGQRLQELAGSQGGQSAAPGLSEERRTSRSIHVPPERWGRHSRQTGTNSWQGQEQRSRSCSGGQRSIRHVPRGVLSLNTLAVLTMK